MISFSTIYTFNEFSNFILNYENIAEILQQGPFALPRRLYTHNNTVVQYINDNASAAFQRMDGAPDHRIPDGLYLLMYLDNGATTNQRFRIQLYPYENLTEDEKEHIEAPITHAKRIELGLRNGRSEVPVFDGNFKIIQFDGQKRYWPRMRTAIRMKPILRQWQSRAAESAYQPDGPGYLAAAESFAAQSLLERSRSSRRSRSRSPSRRSPSPIRSSRRSRSRGGKKSQKKKVRKSRGLRGVPLRKSRKKKN